MSAVEFALFAPVLAFALVAMADIGLALNERSSMDHILRAGSQAAMADPGELKVRDVIETTLAAAGAPAGLSIDLVKRYCACPEDADVAPLSAPDCTTLCTGSAPPFVFYQMDASKVYDAMSVPDILPDFRLASSAKVQVR